MQRDCLILFRSLTYAQRAERVLERAGITATIRKAPQSVSDRGCTYCVKIHAARMERALAVLEQTRLQTGRVFVAEADGTLQEVRR